MAKKDMGDQAVGAARQIGHVAHGQSDGLRQFYGAAEVRRADGREASDTRITVAHSWFILMLRTGEGVMLTALGPGRPACRG